MEPGRWLELELVAGSNLRDLRKELGLIRWTARQAAARARCAYEMMGGRRRWFAVATEVRKRRTTAAMSMARCTKGKMMRQRSEGPVRV